MGNYKKQAAIYFLYSENYVPLLQLLQDNTTDYDLYNHVITSSYFPDALLSVLFDIVSSPIKELICSLEKCPKEVLLKAVTDDSWAVRLNCVSNQNSTVEILKTALTDVNYLVREKVLDSKNFTIELFHIAKEDMNDNIRKKADKVLDDKFKHDLAFISRGI